jgi:hypothetical protein
MWFFNWAIERCCALFMLFNFNQLMQRKEQFLQMQADVSGKGHNGDSGLPGTYRLIHRQQEGQLV